MYVCSLLVLCSFYCFFFFFFFCLFVVFLLSCLFSYVLFFYFFLIPKQKIVLENTLLCPLLRLQNNYFKLLKKHFYFSIFIFYLENFVKNKKNITKLVNNLCKVFAKFVFKTKLGWLFLTMIGAEV